MGQSRDNSADSLEPLFMQGLSDNLFQGLNDMQKGFIASIRLFQGSGEDGDDLLRAIANMLPPDQLFRKELRSLPSVNSEFRTFLDTRCARMTQHSSRRIMMTLASNVYEELEDRQAAIEIIQATIAAGRLNRGSGRPVTSVRLKEILPHSVPGTISSAHNTKTSPSVISIFQKLYSCAEP